MMRRHARSVVIVLGMSVAVALLSACTVTPDRPHTAVSINKVWPPEPARARIAYAGAFSTPKDLGINKGLLTRIAEFITGGSDWHLVRPMAVLPSADGRIYVADPGTRAVHCFDTAQGKHYLILGPDGQAFLSPTGLAIDNSGVLYITDSALARIFVVRPGAETATALDMNTAPEQPTNIAVDQDGYLYVVDALRHHIKVYDSSGRFVRKIGQRGKGDGEFNFPSMIWLDQQGHLLVSDALNFRIQILDLQGRFIGKFGQHGDGSGDMSRPKGGSCR